MLSPLAALFLQTPVGLHVDARQVVVDNGRVRLTVDRRSGLYEVRFGPEATISGVASEARLEDGRTRSTGDYSHHDVAAADIKNVRDGFGRGVEITVRHTTANGPELRQVFWVYQGRSEAFVRLEVSDGKPIASNYLAPIVTESPVRLEHGSPLQTLFVPYDNDMYFRFRSDGWGEGQGDGDGSYEVGAIYDDGSRHGLVVGSIDHEFWKSAVRFKRGGGVRAFAGVTSKYTHDQEPHGMMRGREVRSPRMVMGWYGDWRLGLERYGDLNAVVKPPLPWKGAVPFGWNSWSGHKAKVSAHDVDVATDFVKDELPGFRSGGTAYLNFDSFWDNLTRDQRVAFVRKAHAAGLKAGIYWTPFTCWGDIERRAIGAYTFRDMALKDGKGTPLPQLDGGWPLDPTHPGTLDRIDRELKDFVDQGFDYVKLDFMSHGALEARHFDPRVASGTQAYAVGMQRIVDDLSPKKIGRPFFISLSIAPMFPHGYAHSRRISCDAFANIGASEYLLNSTSYGWWPGGRLYRFNDPDSACVYQPLDEPPVTEAEARTRFTASAISGGMMIQGDDLTKPAARDRVKRLFENREILDLARRTPGFHPIDGDTATKAADAFVWVDGKTAYVAAFNYDKTRMKTRAVHLARLGLSDGRWQAHDMWSGVDRSIEDQLDLRLAPMDCALVRLSKLP
jgi:hypothetical protein